MRHAEDVTFGGSGLDRAAELRGDADALAALAADPASRTLLMWRGKPLVQKAASEPSLVRLPLDHAALDGATGRLFLGRTQGAAIFATDLGRWSPAEVDTDALGGFADHSAQAHPALPDEMRFRDLRQVMVGLDARDAELAATARALFEWHRRHGHCANCGASSEIAQAGWQRRCPECGAKHFPRTDPVVIMLVTHGPRTLLGRAPSWPEGMYSCLAGFVEPGETIEAAVRREVFEETGVRCGRVSYLASQPWPFPASLMIGCHAEALTTEMTLDPVEISDARWVTRETLVAAFAGQDPTLAPARRGAIAQFLLRNWLADRLA